MQKDIIDNIFLMRELFLKQKDKITKEPKETNFLNFLGDIDDILSMLDYLIETIDNRQNEISSSTAYAEKLEIDKKFLISIKNVIENYFSESIQSNTTAIRTNIATKQCNNEWLIRILSKLTDETVSQIDRVVEQVA